MFSGLDQPVRKLAASLGHVGRGQGLTSEAQGFPRASGDAGANAPTPLRPGPGLIVARIGEGRLG